MKMNHDRRDGPAFEPELPISFQNFHKGTRASFTPCAVPDREPDFVSPGRSVYWDLGTAVIRASDHWSDQNGCRDIGGCHWTYEDLCAQGAWEAGICAFAAFARRSRITPTRQAEDEDIALATLLQASCGGVDPRLWAEKAQGRRIPDWARIAPKGTIAAVPAERYFLENPNQFRALTADQSTVERILRHGTVPLPAKIV